MARAPFFKTAIECFDEASEAAGRKLTHVELDHYFSKAEGRIEGYVREGMTREGAAMRAGKELGDEAAVARAIEKRSARINMMADAGLSNRIISDRLVDSFEAMVSGVERKGAFENAGFSLDAMAGARVSKSLNAFFHDLEEAGLAKAFKKADPAFERDVANELGRLGGPEWGRDTGNSQAKAMAEVIFKHQDAVRTAENAAGAWIGKLDQYLARQSHDRAAIRRAGPQKWMDFIRPLLDPKTFKDLLPDEIPEFLAQAYNRLASGVHAGSESGDWLAGFHGPANLAEKVSQERKLFFKSPDAWMDYNKEFGNGSLNGTVLSTLERGSRAVEGMTLLGTNPRAMLDRKIDNAVAAAVKRGDVDQGAALAKQKDRILRLYDLAMRNPRPIENDTVAAIGSNLRAFQRFKLAGSMISSWGDLASTAAMARHNGIGALDSLAWHIGNLFPDGAERQAAMREMGIGWDHMAQSLSTRFGADEGVSGALAKTVDVATRWSLQPWWTQSMKDASSMMLMHNVAEKSAMAHDALPRRMQTTLSRYGIGAAEWDVIRQAAKEAADGNRYTMGGEIASLPDEAFAGLGGSPSKARADLARKYETYIYDQVQEGMSEPTPAIRDILGGGSGKGIHPIVGEAWRTFTQFKQFPASFWARTIMREWSRDGVDVSGLAKVIAGTTLFGYLAMSAKDATRAKTPFNPFSTEYDAGQYAKNVMRAMVQGGGLGIYGDFLLGETNRLGAGPVISLLGPSVGMAADLTKALLVNPREAAMEGKLSAGKVGADLLQAAKNNAPFINLFYARAALDYGVLYSLQETLNPGFLQRFEANTKKGSGQEFLLSPSRAHVPVFGR